MQKNIRQTPRFDREQYWAETGDIWQTYRTLGRHWVDIGQKLGTLGRYWADIGQTLGRHWVDIGQKLESSISLIRLSVFFM